MDFHEKLSEFIKANHINQAAVARDMGIDYAKPNATVNGNRKMDVDEYKKFCKVVKISPLVLLE